MIELPLFLFTVFLAAAAAAWGLAVYGYLRLRLRRKSRDVQTLHDVATTLTSSAAQMPAAPSAPDGITPQAASTLSAIVSIVAKYLEADLVAFLLLDEATGELVTQPGAYGLEGGELHYRLPLSEERSSSVRVFKSGRTFITGDAQNDPGVISSYARLWRIHSLMVIPIRLEGHPIGVMRVGSFRRSFFIKEDIELLSVIADEAAVIVATALLNRRLSEALEQLRAANRMKDDFVSTVSHEFKTPLTTLTGFISVMIDGDTGPLTEQQRRFLTVAKNAAKRLGELVSELLELSQLEGNARMEMKTLALDQIVRQSLGRYQTQVAQKGLALSCDIPASLRPVLGDEKWLALVVDNLISNAVKFTREEGRIRVSVSDKGDFLMVCVDDEGIGIPPQDQERIFEKFFRAANSGQSGASGTGLGLAIAKQIVAKHGGEIWFESEPGRGTRFYFSLPAVSREEALSPK